MGAVKPLLKGRNEIFPLFSTFLACLG